MADLCRVQEVYPEVCYENSVCLSTDVCNAFDPNYADVSEPRNDARINCGFALMKYSGSRGKSGTSDASAELMARVRLILDGAGVPWQTAQLGRVDQGGRRYGCHVPCQPQHRHCGRGCACAVHACALRSDLQGRSVQRVSGDHGILQIVIKCCNIQLVISKSSLPKKGAFLWPIALFLS